MLTTCQTYVLVNQPGCTANFNKDLGSSTSAPTTAGTATSAQAVSSTSACVRDAGGLRPRRDARRDQAPGDDPAR